MKQDPPTAGATLDFLITIKQGFELDGQCHIKVILGEIEMLVFHKCSFVHGPNIAPCFVQV